MAFRKGRSDPNVGTVYFMVFATTNLSMLNDAKIGMQKLNQTRGDCAFSSHFPYKGIFVPKGRKTTDDEEAQVIFEFMEDKSEPVALGEVKRIVIEETPFPYHANALRALEKQRRLTVLPEDQNGNPIERRRKALGSEVSRRPMDVGEKYSNSWQVRFHQPLEQKKKSKSRRGAKTTEVPFL